MKSGEKKPGDPVKSNIKSSEPTLNKAFTFLPHQQTPAHIGNADQITGREEGCLTKGERAMFNNMWLVIFPEFIF